MNKRIRKLADKIWAEEYWDNPATDKLLPAQLNKFAQLIVRECIGIVKQRWINPNEDVIAEEIKQHFGVEE